MSVAAKRRRYGIPTGQYTEGMEVVRDVQEVKRESPDLLLPMYGHLMRAWAGQWLFYQDPDGEVRAEEIGDPTGGSRDIVSGEIRATQETDADRPVLGVDSIVVNSGWLRMDHRPELNLDGGGLTIINQIVNAGGRVELGRKRVPNDEDGRIIYRSEDDGDILIQLDEAGTPADTRQRIDVSNALDEGAEHIVVMRYDQGQDVSTCFVDGVEQGSDGPTGLSDGDLTSNENFMQIGDTISGGVDSEMMAVTIFFGPVSDDKIQRISETLS